MRLSGRLWRSQALGNYQLSPIIQMHRLYSGAIATGELYQLFSRWIHQNSFPTYHRLVQRRMATRAIPTVLCMEIHSAPDTEPMGIPLSHGCVRMRNDDIAELFEQVVEGTRVTIVAD